MVQILGAGTAYPATRGDLLATGNRVGQWGMTPTVPRKIDSQVYLCLDGIGKVRRGRGDVPMTVGFEVFKIERLTPACHSSARPSRSTRPRACSRSLASLGRRRSRSSGAVATASD